MATSHDVNADYASTQPSPVNTEQAQTDKARSQRLFRKGMVWLAIGVALMAISFCINFILFDSGGNFATPMYILTTLGAVCIMIGLGCILGF